MQANARTSTNYRLSLPRFGECRRCSIQSNSAICIAFRTKQYSELRSADACRVRQHCLKHWLEVARRRADDLKHICGRDLLLEGFAQFAEQTRVLNRDDSLRSEVLQQFNLFVGERPYLLAIE
jgi:hypothetical protein